MHARDLSGTQKEVNGNMTVTKIAKHYEGRYQAIADGELILDNARIPLADIQRVDKFEYDSR